MEFPGPRLASGAAETAECTMIRSRADMPSSGAYSCLDPIGPKREEREGSSRHSKWSSLAADTEAGINTATGERTDRTYGSVKAFVDLSVIVARLRSCWLDA